MTHVQILVGDCVERLREIPEESVQCCVTSPPYWGLRDYGVDGQIGLEETPDEFVSRLVAVFREVRRVLRDGGTLWLNLGDSYAGSWGAQSRPNGNDIASTTSGGSMLSARQIAEHPHRTHTGSAKRTPGLKPKDLIGIPWRVAFALQADGWWLRSDIIWHKPNPMPESVRDRPTKAHEYVFLLSKSAQYAYAAEVIAEDCVSKSDSGNGYARPEQLSRGGRGQAGKWTVEAAGGKRNSRTVWSIGTQPFRGAHFATFPPELAARCIKAGCPEGGTVLDPFGGAGTTGLVAAKLGRHAVLLELNPEYAEVARERITGAHGLFTRVEVTP